MENLTELQKTVPSSILIEFFRKTVEKLEMYAFSNEHCSETGDAQAASDSLAVLRLRLIQVQLDTLHRVVEDYNSYSKDSVISIESVQIALKQIGESGMDSEDCNDGDQCLYESMQRMNEAARLAFVRSVINAYQEEIERKLFGKGHQIEEGDDNPPKNSTISRQEILEYFGLLIVALSMDDVQRYLAYGGKIDFSGNSSSFHQQVQVEKLSTPDTRLLLLQGLFLRAVKGHSITENPTVFILREAERLLLPDAPSSSSSSNYEQDQSKDDKEFLRVFENYLSAVRVARENAISSSNLSDLDHDGVTRVVSVTYSEISPTGETNSTMSLPPQQSVMDEHRESEQRNNLSMARKASEMQQTLMDQLLVMDEDERVLTLKEAKEAHDNFLKEALSIPPGPQRILFIQSIDEESQKKLIVHKLWESKLAK